MKQFFNPGNDRTNNRRQKRQALPTMPATTVRAVIYVAVYTSAGLSWDRYGTPTQHRGTHLSHLQPHTNPPARGWDVRKRESEGSSKNTNKVNARWENPIKQTAAAGGVECVPCSREGKEE